MAAYSFPFPPSLIGVYSCTWQWCGGAPDPGEWGVDVLTHSGTPIYAPFAGVVTGENKGACDWGLRMGVSGGPQGETMLFGHLRSTTVSVGERVQAGQLIGYTGGAGNTLHCCCSAGCNACVDPNCGCTTGPHCEVQYMPHGGNIGSLRNFVNPDPYIHWLYANSAPYGSGVQPPSCPPGTHWDGHQCIACPPGTTWNGSVCVSTGPPPQPAGSDAGLVVVLVGAGAAAAWWGLHHHGAAALSRLIPGNPRRQVATGLRLPAHSSNPRRQRIAHGFR